MNGASAAAEAVNRYSQALKQEYGALEQQLDVAVTQSKEQVPKQVLSADSAECLLTLLLTLPHGVQKFSHTVPGPLSPVLSQDAQHLLAIIQHSAVPGACRENATSHRTSKSQVMSFSLPFSSGSHTMFRLP